MSSFPAETSPSNTGTLPRSSRGKDEPETRETRDSTGSEVTCRPRTTGHGNRKQRPHSLYISALENCMSGTEANTIDDSKDGEGFIVAEAVATGTDQALFECLSRFKMHFYPGTFLGL